MILDISVPARHTLPPLPPEFKQMTEAPPDLTADKERDESDDSDDSSLCDNDSEFNVAESSDEKFRSLKFSFMLVCF